MKLLNITFAILVTISLVFLAAHLLRTPFADDPPLPPGGSAPLTGWYTGG